MVTFFSANYGNFPEIPGIHHNQKKLLAKISTENHQNIYLNTIFLINFLYMLLID